jgi:hypothetical protein
MDVNPIVDLEVTGLELAVMSSLVHQVFAESLGPGQVEGPLLAIADGFCEFRGRAGG